MYIELFLLDNLLMDLLTLRLAAAMLSVRPGGKRVFLFAAAGSVAAAVGAGGFTPLLSLPGKLLTALLMSFALPAKKFRGRLLAFLALLLAAVTSGGAVLLTALLFGGGTSFGTVRAGLPLRAALIGALFVSFLPRIIIRILSRRLPPGGTVRLRIEFQSRSGNAPAAIECAALVDTGNTLTEPVSGLPVIVVNAQKYAARAGHASLIIPISTASGADELRAVRPKCILVNGVPVRALVAFSKAETALVPPCLVPAAVQNDERTSLPL